MTERRGIGRAKRHLLHALQHLMAVTAVVCAALIVQNATYIVESGNNATTTVMYPWEVEDNFEDSYLFQTYLRQNINSIARMSVIRNQLETNGVYDGRKKIDIYAYVNRKNDRTFSSDIRAEYYLEDLIKWSEYGFTYAADAWETSAAAQSDGNVLETEKIAVAEAVVEDVQEAAESGTDSSSAGQATDRRDTQASEEHKYVITEASDAAQRLVERYHTVDGRSISTFVNDAAGYAEFVSVLQEASQELAVNYAEYKYLNENYGMNQTNLRYCIQIPTAQGDEYFTNEKIEEIKPDITGHFEEYGKYLYYYPRHMEFETNTVFTENYIRSVLSAYEYTYPENTKIWFAVDTGYPVQDSLYANRQQYQQFMPYYILCLGALTAAALLYLILWVYLTIKEGRPCKIAENQTESRIILNDFDRIPSEAVILMAGIAGVITYLAAVLIANLAWEKISLWMFTGLCAVSALFASAMGMLLYYSMVRRLKAHVLLKHTLCVQLLCLVWRKLKTGCRRGRKALTALSADSGVAARTWTPYLLFLLANLALLFWSAEMLLQNDDIFVFVPLALLLLLDVGIGILQFRKNRTRARIVRGIGEITKGDISYQIPTAEMDGENLLLAEAVNSIGDGIRAAVETSMKDERLKADLITNVSHDIKTPLTSIINYVDLLKRENIQDDKVKGYIDVLDGKSQRLKQLTEDLVEASKISSGNIAYHFERIDFVELLHQTQGEFSEKFEERDLSVIAQFPEESMLIQADSRRIWRVIENLYNNIYKYAMPGTRVYMDVEKKTEHDREYVVFSVKNISAQPLNINANELTERFIRGDVSRSTEGSGLGLSIAKNLTQAQRGSFTVYLDGDLFKVILKFPLDDGAQEKEAEQE